MPITSTHYNGLKNFRNIQMNDEKYMLRCLALARRGKGKVAPNPMVGAVIVFDNKIIGEGWHEKYGQAHAEVNAIASVKDKSLLPYSTMYVSLEPCVHFGKTPPCTDLIIAWRFKKVVIGCVDSFSQVAGKGIEKLRNAGIEVQMNVLQAQCRHINRRFFTFHEKKRPYIILKWAQSQDGFIDRERTNNAHGIHWITHPKTQALTHRWRSEEDAILVGKNTVLNDNPQLTVRAWKGKNPIRILLDRNNTVDTNANIFSHEAPTWVFNCSLSKIDRHCEWIQLNNLHPQDIATCLYQRKIQSLIVEGGRRTLQSFIDADLWDEARILVGRSELKSGLSAPNFSYSPQRKFLYGKDQVWIQYKVDHTCI